MMENMEHSSNMSQEEKDMLFLKKKCEWYNKQQGELEGYDCPLCLNKGYIADVQDEIIGYIQCKCIIKRQNEKRLKESGLLSIKSYTFDNYRITEKWQEVIFEKANDFLKDIKEKWFFIGGQPGCGKTHICTAICLKLMEIGKRVKYMLWLDEIPKIKASVMDSVEYQELINVLKTIEVLYIDDFFKTVKGGTVSNSDIKIAMEIINYRYLNKLTTIISSERSISDLMMIDEAIGSRISERCQEFKINIGLDTNKNQRM